MTTGGFMDGQHPFGPNRTHSSTTRRRFRLFSRQALASRSGLRSDIRHDRSIFPGLRLKSGEVAFPLPPAQVKAIREAAEPAPYGLGAKTKLDQSVRRCWQIDASELAFDNPAWQTAIAALAKRIGEELGIEGAVVAHPYNLATKRRRKTIVPKAPVRAGDLLAPNLAKRISLP